MPESGTLCRGVVVRLLAYGAMVRLDDGTTGLVHISEIDEKFVADVTQYLALGARVTVKVLAIKEGGKIEFSIKRAKGAASETEPAEELADTQPIRQEPVFSPRPAGSRAALDEKMREFMADSTEILSDVRRHNESKLGLRRR